MTHRDKESTIKVMATHSVPTRSRKRYAAVLTPIMDDPLILAYGNTSVEVKRNVRGLVASSRYRIFPIVDGEVKITED